MVGILINCVLLSLFIGVIINHRNFTSTFMSVVFIYVIAIQNGAMTTSVLTGGMFIPPLLFFFFNIKSLRLMRVCHLTSVHKRYDSRIFIKQCTSLARHGHDVTLVVADDIGR